MAIDIKYDLIGNPEPPTIVLANRNGNKLGQLYVDAGSINLIDKLNEASEIAFTLYKYIDGKVNNLWDKVVNFKLIYCKEWDCWFEITVELDEETETVKTVLGTQLGQAELSQIMLYDIHVNEEGDPNWDKDNETYKNTILYDIENSGASLLHRLLEKAPHYSIGHVDDTLINIQRTFSFDDTSIYDALQDVAEEIGCLFVFHSDSDEYGMPRRVISVYDLQQNCNDCGHRGEFTNSCPNPKCPTNLPEEYPDYISKGMTYGYGEDTTIFVTSDELASGGIQLTTDTDAVKNCFKLEAGDDLMTATIRNRNPNGTDYIWYFSDDMKADMPDEMVEKIESYDELYKYYYNDYIASRSLLSQESTTLIVGKDIQVGDTLSFECPASEIFGAAVSYEEDLGNGETSISGLLYTIDSMYPPDYIYKLGLTIDKNIISVTTKKFNIYLVLDNQISEFNNLVEKYKIYNEDLQTISTPIVGFAALMEAYYNTIDLSWYLKSGLMPDVTTGKTNAEEQATLLQFSLPPLIAVTNLEYVSNATADSYVLQMARAIVNSSYKVTIKSSNLQDNDWSGIFIVENYSDEEDTYTTSTISRTLTDFDETYIKQKVDKILSKENTDNLSVTGLFEKDYDEFCAELKKYALVPLTSFHNACQACIDILIEQGVGNTESYGKTETGADGNLYEKLYVPYYNKLKAIESEIKVREDELSIILGSYDNDGNLYKDGTQTIIEKIKVEIQDKLNFQNYFGEDLWKQFCAYRREDKYSNSNYISDGLNNAELFKRALEFYEVAENEIFKSSELQHSISATLNNLLAISKFKSLVKFFKVGNWIRVLIDDRVYKLRLLEYEIDYGDFDNISVEFSDVSKVRNGVTDIEDILSQASSMASSYDSIQRQANLGNDAQNKIRQWLDEGLDASLYQIQNNVNEEIIINQNGLIGRSKSDITGEYSPEQIRITHNIMAYTDDDWASVKMAIGKHEYRYYDEGENDFIEAEGYGVSADFVTAGIVSGSQIIGGNIYSYNYSPTAEACRKCGYSGEFTEETREETDESGNTIQKVVLVCPNCEAENSKKIGTGSYINLVDGTFSFGGGALRFEDGKLVISDSPADTNIAELNDEWLKITSVYAQNLNVNAAKVNGTLTAANIDAGNVNAGTLTGMEIIGGSLSIGYDSSYNSNTSPEIWVQSEDPEDTGRWNTNTKRSKHVGDLWYNTDDDMYYEYTSDYEWVEYSDVSNASGYTTYAEITNKGILNCKGANISGHINATSGTIGGCEIIDNTLTVPAGVITAGTINAEISINAPDIYGGNIYGGMFYATGQGENGGAAYYIYSEDYYDEDGEETDSLVGFISYDTNGSGEETEDGEVMEATNRVIIKTLDVPLKLDSAGNMSLTAGGTIYMTSPTFFSNRIILTNTSWGETLPSDGVYGQLFFKLA